MIPSYQLFLVISSSSDLEILVKYMPLANNHLVKLLEREGAEAVVPDLMDFLNYSFYNNQYKTEFLGSKKTSALLSDAAIKAIRAINMRKEIIPKQKATVIQLFSL